MNPWHARAFVFLALAGVAARAEAQSLITSSTSSNGFISASSYYTHCVNGYFWVAMRLPAGVTVYSSPDGRNWTSQGTVFSFLPVREQWAVRYSGDTLVAFANDVGNVRRYRKATLNANGTLTWNAAEAATGPADATNLELNTGLFNGKPILWRAGTTNADAGFLRIGDQLNAPVTWTDSPSAPALGTNYPTHGTLGAFFAGAVLPVGGADPNDLIILRATSNPVQTAGNHRLVSVKYDASLNAFDGQWYNVSTLGGSLAEGDTTEVADTDDLNVHYRFVAIRDGAGDVHALYVNQGSRQVVHYRKAAGFNDSWSRVSADVAQRTVISKLGISSLGGSRLLLFYEQSLVLYYRVFDGTSWSNETTLHTATDFQKALAPIENVNGCAPGLAVTEEPVSPFMIRFISSAAGCNPLSVSAGSDSFTVTSPGAFELVFDQLAGGSVGEFYDLAIDSSRTWDLAGGTNDVVGLLHLGWETTGSGGYHKTTEDDRSRLHLLEATPLRVKLRADAGFTDDSIGRLYGLRLVSDYTVANSGRIATNWNLRATETHTVDRVPMGLGVHYSSSVASPLNKWTSYSESGIIGANPPGDDFVMAENDDPAIQTDFLHIAYQDWTTPPYTLDPNVIDAFAVNDWVFPVWRDTTLATLYPADTSEHWQTLTYFKPTNFADHLSPLVTERRNDYRSPAVLTIAVGSAWPDASERTSGGDDFNEAEATYLLTADPVNGLTFDIDGNVNPRHSPVFKIRHWRSLSDPTQVTLQGTLLLNDAHYIAAVKPLSRAHASQDIVLYSTLQSSAAVSTPNVGVAGVILGTPTFVAARYGNGARFDGPSDTLRFSSATSFDVTKGTVEFWVKPEFNHTDNARRVFWTNEGSGGDFFGIEKSAANNLEFAINNGTLTRVRIAPADYGWNANEWVHLRAVWEESQAPGLQLRLFVNGAEPPHTDSGTYSSSGMTSTDHYIGNISAGTFPAIAVIDEFHVYDGAFQPSQRANGGLESSTLEFLASASRNLTLQLFPRDAQRRTDYFYFGADTRFRGLNVTLATQGQGTPDLIWEYWNGTSWTDLRLVSGFTDELNDFTERDGTIYWGVDPPGWSPYSVNGGPDLYYVRLHASSTSSYTTFPVEALVKTDILLLQYCSNVTMAAQTFAITAPLPTEVDLLSFDGRAIESGVVLTWETASELDNLGFHVYRSEAGSNVYHRLTPALIPGLGSSPAGARYSYLDRSVTPGIKYSYRLDDVDRRGKTTGHGPIEVEVTGLIEGAPAGDGADDVERPSSRMAFGRPEANGLRVLRNDGRRAVVELATEGFYLDVFEDGRSRIWTPGLDELLEERLGVPVKRAMVDAVLGVKTQLAGVRVADVSRFASLPGLSEVDLSLSGDNRGVATTRRRLRDRTDGRAAPDAWARLEGDLFQGDRKKASLSFFPIRYDAASSELLLARRIRVTLSFRGRAEGEAVTRDGKARRRRADARGKDGVLVRLVAREPGVYSIRYEDLFGERGRKPLDVGLSRRGAAVPYHLEPPGAQFGPGATLYFFSEGQALNPYDGEAVYELRAGQGRRMFVVSPAPDGGELETYLHTDRYEESRFYQAGLVDEDELWLWDILVAPVTKRFPVTVSGLSPGEGKLVVRLQGTSDLEVAEDHHVRLYVNDVALGELRWGGRTARLFEASLPAGVLANGENVLSIENVGDTGAAYSMVMLDRFDVIYPRAIEGYPLSARFEESGTVSLEGPTIVLRQDGTSTSWVRGIPSGAGYRVRVEPGATYRMSAQALLPEARRAGASNLERREPVDWLAIAPASWVESVTPLARHRSEQGLRTKVVAVESVYDRFGYGERSPEAIRRFVAHAYHEWGGLQYVVLVGDSSYDPKDFLGTGKPSLVPSDVVRTSYLWTASDVALAAVNGDDALPDVAIGRLPAATVEELDAMVRKILAHESSAAPVDETVVLVTDNADVAGNFKANAEAIARELLRGRPHRSIHLEELGVARARSEILATWSEGAGVVSYIGHGAIHQWASENLLHIDDVPSLSTPLRHPLLLTLNCLNGYFHFPHFDALSERLVKADGRGAIAAFSPTGLSLNDPAHELHRFVMDALVSGRHERLGDAVLEAQSMYAESGAFPELLSIYHVLGDPALRLR